MQAEPAVQCVPGQSRGDEEQSRGDEEQSRGDEEWEISVEFLTGQRDNAEQAVCLECFCLQGSYDVPDPLSAISSSSANSS